MAVELWPPITPVELQKAEEEDLVLIDVATGPKQRELTWVVEEIHDTLQTVRHGLEDCYALLAPIDPGSTLPLTTPGKEFVKGVMSRVGTRIVRGTIHIRLRTLPAQTLTIDPSHPIHIGPLLTLTNLINQAIEMLTLTLSVPVNPHFMNAQLRLFTTLISDASIIIKGPPPIPATRDWTTESLSPIHFAPPMGSHQNPASSSSASSVFSSSGSIRAGVFGGGSSSSSASEKDTAVACPPMSMHLGLREGNLVLYLRSLEPVLAPVGFGTRLALAIGTTRRLEHDEADRVFSFTMPIEGSHRPGSSASMGGSSIGSAMEGGGSLGSGPGRKRFPVLSGTRRTSAASVERKREMEVYVREKVEVVTGDPSLISVQLKLNDIGHKVDLARSNLAAALGGDAIDG